MSSRLGNNCLIPAALVILSFLIRVPDLGKWPMSEDEFYFSQSVDFILEKGYPEFPAGGYYNRGLALQYATAFLVPHFDKREFALRLIPLVCGVVAILLFYKICTIFLPASISAFSTLVIVLSSWHIEYSRFARFYMPFQLVFFAFIYFFYKGYWGNSRKYQLASWGMAILSVFVYEGCIFVPLILLAFILFEDRLHGKRVALLFLSLALVFLAYIVNYYGGWKVADSLPAGNSVVAASFLDRIPIVWPKFDLLEHVVQTPIALVGYASLWILAIYLFKRHRKEFKTYFHAGVFALLMLLPLTHQFLLAICFLAVVALFDEDIRSGLEARIYPYATYCAIAGLYWILIAYHSGNLKYVLHYTVGYPPIKNAILRPIFVDFPVWGGLLFVPFLISIIRNLVWKQDGPDTYTLKITLLLMIMIPLFRTPFIRTRYIFFFFPLFILIAQQEFHALANYLKDRPPSVVRKGAWWGVVSIPFLVFVLSEDFNYRHLTNVSAVDANFRLDRYSKYFSHWYPRVDIESPSEYVNENYRKGDVVVLDHVTMAPYMEKPYVHFVSRRIESRFRYHATRFGTEEKWTGMPLISSYEDLDKMVPRNDGNVLWLISIIDKNYNGGSFVRSPNTPEEIGNRYHANVKLKYVGVDKRIGVWEIQRDAVEHRSERSTMNIWRIREIT